MFTLPHTNQCGRGPSLKPERSSHPLKERTRPILVVTPWLALDITTLSLNVSHTPIMRSMSMFFMSHSKNGRRSMWNGREVRRNSVCTDNTDADRTNAPEDHLRSTECDLGKLLYANFEPQLQNLMRYMCELQPGADGTEHVLGTFQTA